MKSLFYLASLTTFLISAVFFLQEIGAFEELPKEWHFDAEKRQECKTKCDGAGKKKVCGIFGHWYANKCEINCLGFPQGPEDVCQCIQEKNCFKQKVNLVCGVAGSEHINECKMLCLKDTKAPNEDLCECVDECRQKPHKAVCGSKGNIYYNECSLNCRKDQGVEPVSDFSKCKSNITQPSKN